MKVRKTIPEAGNKFYNTISNGGYSQCIKGYPMQKDLDVLSNCVGYACGRFNELIGEMKYPTLYCNAERFIDKAKKLGLETTNVPTLGGIMVWEGKGSLAGHVAVVEEILSPTEICTSESSYGGSAFRYIKRVNTNGNWGVNSPNYTFIGCIVNPAIGKVIGVKKETSKKDNKITTGNYKCLSDMYVRAGAGTCYAIKKVKALTKDGQRNAKVSDPEANAIYKDGTIFTALSIISNENGTWAKTPSGYVCIIGVSKKVYCEYVS